MHIKSKQPLDKTWKEKEYNVDLKNKKIAFNTTQLASTVAKLSLWLKVYIYTHIYKFPYGIWFLAPIMIIQDRSKSTISSIFPLKWHKCWPVRASARTPRNHLVSNVQLCSPFVVFHRATLEWEVKAIQRVSPPLKL